MTPALRAGAEKASRRWLFLALMRTASVRPSSEIPERFAPQVRIGQPVRVTTGIATSVIRHRGRRLQPGGASV